MLDIPVVLEWFHRHHHQWCFTDGLPEYAPMAAKTGIEAGSRSCAPAGHDGRIPCNDAVASSVTTMDEEVFDLAGCVERVRRHDQAAARSLVDHLYPLVIKIVRGKLPRRDSEEDLMQEIFIKMFTKLDQYQATCPFDHWVSRIAVNHCLNALRAQRHRPECRRSDLTEEQDQALDAVTTSASLEPHPAHVIGARELVNKILETLDPEDQLLIRMLEMEERSIDEIRQVTGWSSTRIRVRAFRARQKLNKRFGRLRKEGEL